MNGAESLRAFVAVPLSEEVRAAALELQRRVREEWGEDVKWVEGANLHVTLKFLGQVEVGKMREVEEALERVAGDFAPFQVRTGGLGTFPSPGRIRVVWYGLREGEEKAAALGHAVEESLRGLGFEAEERFHAHITLGRVRRGREGRVAGWPHSLVNEDQGCWMPIDRFVLMQSVLSRGGPTYGVLREFLLSGQQVSEEQGHE